MKFAVNAPAGTGVLQNTVRAWLSLLSVTVSTLLVTAAVAMLAELTVQVELDPSPDVFAPKPEMVADEPPSCSVPAAMTVGPA